MPCYIRKANSLGIRVQLDEAFEKELMRSLRVNAHDELVRVVEAMPDSSFVTLVKNLLKRRRKTAFKHFEEHEGIVEAAYIG